MAFSAALVWQIQNGGSDSNAGAFRGGASLSTPSAPTVAISSGGSITNATYYVVVTLTDGNGETAKSAESSVTSSGANHTITVTAPTNPSSQSATWNVYFGTTSGGPYFAGTAGTGLLFTANYAITATPPTTGTQAPGVDYSQQNAAQVTYTDLVIGNPTTTNLTSAANPFTPAHVGNVINVTSGTNFTVQRLEVTGVTAAGVATVDKTAGTAGATGGNGKLGGALVSPALAFGQSTAGNGVFLKYHATPYSMANSNNVSGGNINGGNPAFLVGYDTTRDRGNADANRPTLTAGANNMTLMSYSRAAGLVANLILDAVARTGCAGLTTSGGANQVRNVKATFGTNVNNVLLANSTTTYLGCEVQGGDVGFKFQANCVLIGCVASSCISYGFNVASYQALFGCVARACGSGYSGSGSGTMSHCVAYANTTNGFATSGGTHILVNCISYGNTGSAVGYTGSTTTASMMLYCAAGGNGGGNLASTSTPAAGIRGFITLSADPFTNAAGLDFSLNSAAGGGALLRVAGYPSSFPGLSTLSYPDVGAAQNQAVAAPSGGGCKILASSIIQSLGVV